MARTADVYPNGELSDRSDIQATGLASRPLLGSELVYFAAPSKPQGLVQFRARPPPADSGRPLESGEQYRFHFDMTKCIGYKCCVVACNEQNGNPAAINWSASVKSKAAISQTQRYNLSMGLPTTAWTAPDNGWSPVTYSGSYIDLGNPTNAGNMTPKRRLGCGGEDQGRCDSESGPLPNVKSSFGCADLFHRP